ncbi:hypothetical protein FZEAL_9895 [Fusarium zealandicum]|uniref:Uncharacterized protein n=1 Tax=Fusarium zealandicum TaxID=1053134 RepID=A0A8H4XEG1_9HYPO|nr:hypothetical protein FZEAL_9895 [Fusarium zealandicum]
MTEDESTPEPFISIVEKDAPKLKVLPDLPSCTLERSSTLRACIEKAADDINVEFGSVRSLPDAKICHRRLPLQESTDATRNVTPIPTMGFYRPRRWANIEATPAQTDQSIPSDEKGLHCPSCNSQRCCRRKPENLPTTWDNSTLVGSLSLRDPSQLEKLEQEKGNISRSRVSSITTIQLPPSIIAQQLSPKAAAQESGPASQSTNPVKVQSPFVPSEGYATKPRTCSAPRERSLDPNGSQFSLASCSSASTAFCCDRIALARIKHMRFTGQPLKR